MGKHTIFDSVREYLAGFCFNMFLKLNKIKEEEYFKEIRRNR